MALPVAIVGLSCRAPSASSADGLWSNIRNGRCGLRRYELSTLRQLGIPEAQLADPQYVPVSGFVGGFEQYDPDYFRFSRAEALAVNPQLRALLEISVDALADAGLLGQAPALRTGVFVCCTSNDYALRCLEQRNKGLRLTRMQIALLNKTDYIATQIAYRLNLKGPAMMLQSACSSSLVAVHVAAQTLRAGEADVCLAGGISIRSLVPGGYLAVPGTMLSPSGVCRPFDDEADGTIFGDGGGIVALMTLERALSENRRVYATLIGSAVNNDGHDKLSFVAPSVAGQTDVYAAALRHAGVAAESISYVEAHGTGTRLGDPMEVEALQAVYGSAAPHSIALGALKGNIGHLDAGAGVVGLIKTALSLHHRNIAPNVGATSPNTKIDWGRSPFYLPETLADWPCLEGAVRRAAVTALGVGGTNAHMVLEEAPTQFAAERRLATARAHAAWPIPVSAQSPAALRHVMVQGEALTSAEPERLCKTYTSTRPSQPYRGFGVLRPRDDGGAIEWLNDNACGGTGLDTDTDARPNLFMFPGQGMQTPGMGSALYRRFSAFAATVEEGLAELPAATADLIRKVFFSVQKQPVQAELAERTDLAQPGLLLFQVALTRLLATFSVEPAAMIGHSVGEIACAVASGAMSLVDAVHVVYARGTLCELAPNGAMLAVGVPHEHVAHLLDGLPYDLAAENAPEQFVIAGDADVVATAADRLMTADVPAKVLSRRYGFHSARLDSVLARFGQSVQHVCLSLPRVPYVSTATGDWFGDGLKHPVEPSVYFPTQLRSTVRFRDGLRTLRQRFANARYWELGRGQVLTRFAQAISEDGDTYLHPAGATSRPSTRSSARSSAGDLDVSDFFDALGRAWIEGQRIEWSALDLGDVRPLPLPVPMVRRLLWIDARGNGAAARQPGQQAGGAATVHSNHEERAALGAADPEAVAGAVTETVHLMADVREIWRSVLNLDRALDSTDFFKAGGDSLLAIQLTAALKARTGHTVHPREVYRFCTPQQMCAHLSAVGPTANAVPVEPDAAAGIDTALTPSEQWMLAWAQASRHVPLFNIVCAFKVREALDVPRLHDALLTLLRRAPRLHQTVDVEHRRWRTLPVDERFLCSSDWSGKSPEARERELVRYLHDAEQTPLMLNGGPLFALQILKFGEREYVLISRSHHIVWDGWSSSVFWRGLFGTYLTGQCREHAPAPAFPALDSDDVLRYWRDKMIGLDRVRAYGHAVAGGNAAGFAGIALAFELAQERTAALSRRARILGMPMAVLLLAAYAHALIEVMREETVWVRLPVTNRSQENRDTIGFQLLTVVCRIARCDEPDRFLHDVQTEVEQTLAHQAVAPLTLMELASSGETASAQMSPFPYEFNHHMYLRRTGGEKGSLDVEPIGWRSPTTYTKCDVALESRETETSIRAALVGRESAVSRDTLNRIAKAMQSYLQQIAQQDDSNAAGG
jgi:acyl transferase domain-containing protein